MKHFHEKLNFLFYIAQQKVMLPFIFITIFHCWNIFSPWLTNKKWKIVCHSNNHRCCFEMNSIKFIFWCCLCEDKNIWVIPFMLIQCQPKMPNEINIRKMKIKREKNMAKKNHWYRARHFIFICPWTINNSEIMTTIINYSSRRCFIFIFYFIFLVM